MSKTRCSAPPYEYLPHYQWFEVGGKLEFFANIPTASAYKIRVWHAAPSAAISLDADTINDDINLQRLTFTALYYLLKARARNAQNTDANLEQDVKMAERDMMRLALMFPVRLLSVSPRLA